MKEVQAFLMQCHWNSFNAGWWHGPNGEDLRENPYVIPTKLMLAVSELAEGMEGFRKGLKDDKLPHRDMLEVELADALIRIADLAGALGYDLAGAVIEKMEFNQRRADHKPEQRAQSNGKKF